MSNLILLIILWSFLECAYKKIPIYEEFISFGYIYQMMLKGKYQRVLVLATGALLNPVMTNQKLSIPCVCHGYVLEVVK